MLLCTLLYIIHVLRSAIQSIGLVQYAPWVLKVTEIFMLQQWVDFIFVPSGRLMVSGFVAIRLLSTGVPSMMKMAITPVSTIACVINCRRLCPGAPNRARAVAAIVCRWTFWMGVVSVFLPQLQSVVVVLDVILVISLSSTSFCILLIWVGVREISNAQFILSATCISAPICQNAADN